MTVRYYSSTATPKNLVAGITNSTTTIQLSDAVGLPNMTPFTLALDYETPIEELVDVTAIAGTTFTVTRGVDGTSATSHTGGALVRHVSSARDYRDSRNHENADDAVHGLSVGSDVVGTTDVQTLSNKTLAGVTITGPITGTITGNPAFSGNPSFTGNPTFSGGPVFSGTQSFTTNTTFSGEIDTSQLIRSNRTNATDSLIEGRVTGDANARWFVRENGDTLWGPGSAVQDVTLRRVGAGAMEMDSTLAVSSSSTSSVASHFEVITTAGAPSNSKILDLRGGGLPVAQITNGGFSNFTPQDTSVDGMNINMPLGTTGDVLDMMVNSTSVATFDNGGILRNYQQNTPLTYTPAVTGGGAVVFNQQVGYYYIVGKMVFVTIYLTVTTPGTGTTPITIGLPSTPFRAGAGPATTRQVIPGYITGVAAGTNSSVSGAFGGVVLASGTNPVIDAVNGPTNIAMRGEQLAAGISVIIQGWYREV